ncbi:MAG: peptidoglycan-binding protein [Candidatus Parcubacteria bacterium]|nr:peptidoglycan-binding protein [Leptolyngbyaceae cyanobacterium LF-bin-113]
MDRCLIKASKARNVSRWWVCFSTLSFLCLSSASTQIAASAESRALTISQAPAPERLNPIPASEGTGRAILRSGSRGADVNELQATLRLLGFYDGAVDGFFEETTVAAVGRFQEAAGLSKDGVVGPATWERLFPPNPVEIAPTPTVQPAAPAVKPRETAPAKSTPQAAPTSAAFPILRKGITGDAVRGLQERLRSLGLFDGSIDGVFGEATETAVKAAQRKYRLDPDGIVGPGTWSALLR